MINVMIIKGSIYRTFFSSNVKNDYGLSELCLHSNWEEARDTYELFKNIILNDKFY